MQEQLEHVVPPRTGARRGKVLFIGLDAAEPLLLRRYMDAGELPAIASLVHNGNAAMLPSPPGLGNGGTWPAAFTGVGPASNGRYYYLQFDPATYRFAEFNEDVDFSSPPFWTLASAAGKRVAVIDMVRGPLASSINGVQVVDWLTHDRMRPARSMPTELITSVEKEFGADPWGGHADNAYAAQAEKDPAAWLARAAERIERKGAYSQRLLASEDWDLFATVFSDPHDFGHLFWHLHDAGHPAFDHAWYERHGDPFKPLYRAIDRNVARLIETAGPDAHVILFTGPGMGPNYSANLALEEILRRLEFSYTSVPMRRRVAALLRTSYKRALPAAVRSRINLTHRVRSMAPRGPDDFDPHGLSERLFFAVPHNDNAGAVRLNIAGRESRGVLSPADANALMRRLVSDLCEIRNDETGQPLVAEAVVAKEHFSGPHAGDLPDLFVVWNRPKPIRRIASPRIGRLAVPSHPVRSGDHTDRVFIVHRSGLGDAMELDATRFRAEDIAPTILHLLGVPVAGTFDGVSRVRAHHSAEAPVTAASSLTVA